jgi:two-component system KDP operon response regulator KdpE
MLHVLVVDEDKRFRTSLTRALKTQGYRVTGIASPDVLISSLAIYRPDVVVLDLVFNMTTNSLEICRTIRNWSAVPLIVLSSYGDEDMKVKAFDSGATSYLLKPFALEVLLADIEALTYPKSSDSVDRTSIFQIGDLTINLGHSQIVRGNETIHLTRYECGVLKTLLLADGEPVTYDVLLSSLFGSSRTQRGERATIRVVIKQLRRKLKEDLTRPLYLLTEAGVGYRFNTKALQQMQALED